MAHSERAVRNAQLREALGKMLESKYGDRSSAELGVGLTQLLDHVYIGSYQEATNVQALRAAGITHVFNAAQTMCVTGADFYAPEFEFMGIDAEDSDDYPLLPNHWEQLRDYVELARKDGGKVLIHCMAGINRSGCLCLAYATWYLQQPLFTVVSAIKPKRKHLVFNEAFQRQLIDFADGLGLLVPPPMF